MSGHSSYHSGPASHSFYSSHSSTSPSNSGQMYTARDMLPPSNMDFPPLRPMEIDINSHSILNSSRTLPNPSASAPAAWGDSVLFGSHPLETQFGSSHIPRSHQPSEPSARTSQPDPLVQWYAANDGPWIPQQIKDAGPDERSMHRQAGIRMPQSYGHHYRSSNHMDGGSFPYSVPHSDSGYGTRHSVGNTSVFSGDVNDRDQDSQSLLGPSPDYHPYPGYNESLQMQSHEGRTSDSWSTPGSGLSPSPSSGLTCPTCLKPVKTPSELKKHDLRHRKPFMCTVHGCKRIGGFSTSNDLERHNKSKHPTLAEVALTKRFRCLVPGCKSKDKSWPRLDNFRSHLKRVHGNCLLTDKDTEQTIQRGEYMDASRDIEQDDQLQDIQSDYTHMEKPAAAEVVSRQGNAWRNLESLGPCHGSIPPVGSVLEIPSYKSHHRRERTPICERSRQETVKPVEVFSLQLTSLSKSVLPLHRDVLNITSLIDSSLTGLDTRISKDVSTDGKAEKEKDISASDPAVVEVVKTVLAAVNKTQQEASHNQTTDLENLPDGRIKDPNLDLLSRAGIHIPDDRSGFSSSDLDINDPDARKNAQVLEVLKILTKLGFSLQKDPSPSAKLLEVQPNITTTSKSDKKVTCPTCKNFTGRPCELKKHMKRHSRPYGCTFANCTKTFGSKNDWKRHENSQHLHQETLRCNISREDDIGVCGKVLYRRQTFQEHLKNHHHMKDDTSIKEKLESCRIGRNGQSRFWCGFCRTTVELKKKGTNAWNERFDHIDDHFVGRIDGRIIDDKALNIRDWLYVNSDKPRGDVDSPPSSKEGSDHESTPSEASGSSPAAIVLDAVDKGQTLKRKRRGEVVEEEIRPSKIRKQIIRICCQCNAPNNPRFDSSCNTCDRSHSFCDACEFQEQSAPLTTGDS